MEKGLYLRHQTNGRKSMEIYRGFTITEQPSGLWVIEGMVGEFQTSDQAFDAIDRYKRQQRLVSD